MTHNTPLPVKALYRHCDNSQLKFNTTAELPELEMMPGQERALAALRFGLGILHPGYHLYILGPSGAGKRNFVEQYLQQQNRPRQVPADYCYVHNFQQPHCPRLIQLAAGKANELRQDMQQLTTKLSNAISTGFDTDKYRARRAELEDQFTHAAAKKALKALNRETALSEVAPLVDELKRKYSPHDKLQHYLDGVREDVIEHLDKFHTEPYGQTESSPWASPIERSPLAYYQINVLVDNSRTEAAPLIYADNPLPQNLLGRIDYKTQTGCLITDFSLIKAGALHQANGGYLLLDAAKLVQQPLAWEGLKRALLCAKLDIPPLTEQHTGISLEPEAMPLHLKVILLGERALYQQLFEDDAEFARLFKVAVDLNDDIDYTNHNIKHFAQFIASLSHRDKLRPFDRTAVARVIEQSARLAEDKQKLSLHLDSITDLLREADYWAGEAQQQTVSLAHIQQAIEQQIQRMARFQYRSHEEIHRGVLLIDTQGEKVAQVNGLTIIEQGEHAFGQPSRITATARLGDGDVVDIEREVDLGGPLHSKGVFILTNFLGARFAKNQPLSLHASLVFEQTYDDIDGDSASMAELCALLSALANAPIKQSLAITGSVNQLGESQVIGGVNEKIEGFYDVCLTMGLNGQQGVLIPAANVQHLMLREDVRDAAQRGEFQIYAYEHIDQAIEILTGIPAGTLNDQDEYPEGSINQRVYARLAELEDIRERTHKDGKDD